MKELPIDASDDTLRDLVVEWSELLADERYSEALAMFLHTDVNFSWTPALLELVIRGYGVPDPDQETLEYMHEEYKVERFVVTTLRGRDDYSDIRNNRIDVDRENLYGLAPDHYLGMVHYNDVPLNGFRSDLTARFHIKRVGADQMTLEFLDLHVM